MDNVVLVLFQPEDVVNVAGVVRAMSNFGLKDLRLVEPAAFDAYRVEGIAHHTGEIIERVRRYPSLEEAVADCSLVLGTTGRPRRVRRERLTPREAAPIVLRTAAAHPGAPVALLFGRERDGLPNSALDLCHAVVTIPTSPENHSLNLAQAVLVIAYELWLAAVGTDREQTGQGAPEMTFGARTLPAALEEPGPLATGAAREAMFAALDDMLRALYPGTTESRLGAAVSRLRAIVLRAAPRADEARLLSHLFRHIARVARTAYAARQAAGARPPGPDAARPEPGGRGADPAGPTS
ncbi:RNA methyltransferase [Caldinitratiruptor microaerophilus]|uniref:tRNA (Cytidine/uridine-2'-O-)-methyltransferase TrmJ n=1 Tax=Caldinitratiruptor microaerophilus TaxID=671077 RepID=A0AA35G7H5_9FIRM|nr:TrmH family RNA methyltransferase [Caldinitratiruptor microaerophilus]BDG59328.1 tRNA (cytidine/uridine-2'-O-)-methyltransferase TrmJ [Caldinitratiruptor microaerophilus]